MDALSKIFDDIHLNKAEYIYVRACGEWCFQMDAQPAVMAHIVLTGTMYMQYGEQSLIAKAGDIVLIPSGIEHIVSSDEQAKLVEAVHLAKYFQDRSNEPIALGDASQYSDIELASNPELMFSLSFKSDIDTIMAGPLLNALPQVMHIQSLMTSRTPEWLQIGLMFVGIETQQMRPGRDKILDHLVSILFIECVRDYICGLSDQTNWLNALTHPQLSNALAAIHAHPQQGWTVESLAEQCCMSRSKFASVFHSVVGEPPLGYLQQYRLRLASQMLRQSNLNIQQIAGRIGYASETAFSQAFKRQFEITPKQYRQTHLATLKD